MNINRKKFFDGVRHSPFNGKLTKNQVATLDTIINEWERRKLTFLPHLAYMMATVLRECGPEMQPVREGFKETDKEARAFIQRMAKKTGKYKYVKLVNGVMYYGRGLVQLTWYDNYVKMGKILRIDLAGNPDKALELDVAVQIMFEGMTRGTFTGKKLDTYLTPKKLDWTNARRIINGTDHAAEVANNAKAFHSDLVIASA